MSEKTKQNTIERKRTDEILDRVQAAYPDALLVEDKSGFKKITSVASGNKVYVQLRDDVREVHLSGWGDGLPGTIPPPKKNGKVFAWLDMNGDDPYAALEALLEALATQAAPTKAVAAPKVPKEPKPKKAESDDERLTRIKARVKELDLESTPTPVAVEATAEVEVVVADESSVDTTALDGQLDDLLSDNTAGE
ncbi:MAG: hypothetical protein WC763_06050 [Candidatus Paceibacterota bacterium]|jgi:hypothetical protein